MQFFARWRSRRPDIEIVADGLKQFGTHREAFARWVINGVASKAAFENNAFERGPSPTPDETAAMMDVVGSAAPIAEWRLGELISYVSSKDPDRFDPLFRLWCLRGCQWPSDKRIHDLVEVSGFGGEAFLQYALVGTVPFEQWLMANRSTVLRLFTTTGRGLDNPMTELRRRPIFSRLVLNYPEVVKAEFGRSATAAPKVASALTTLSSPQALAPLTATIAELASDKSKNRRAAGDELAQQLGYETLVPHFKRLIADGDAATRAHAIRAWETRAGTAHLADVIDYTTVCCADDRSPTVRRAIAELGRDPVAEVAAAEPVFTSDDPEIATALNELTSDQAATRASAATRLADLDATATVDALHHAVGKEDEVRATFVELRALERLGAPIAPYLKPQKLMTRNRKGFRRKMPAAGAWIPLETLPSLRWADGTIADPKIVEWLVIDAIRSARPASPELARAVFDLMQPETVHRFCDAVLQLWLAEDLAPLQSLAPEDGVKPAGSAIGTKGLLSLVAAGGDGSVVAPAAEYVRNWYRHRAPQAKALIDMLAGTECPDAIQFLLEVMFDLSTPGIRSEAFFRAQQIAEREGLTLDELAYRIAPSAGFDADGRQILDTGARRFTVELGDDLAIALLDGDGEAIDALPPAAPGDDPDRVEQASAQLSDAQQRVASAANVQPRWLLDAMCVQQPISVDDFERFIVGHPVMVRLASRLVWAAIVDGERLLFRPLIDGSLQDGGGAAVDLGAAQNVTLAHEVIDGVEAGSVWASHFAEQGIAPLFPQFGRPALPEFETGQDGIFNFEGAVISGRQLRNVLPSLSFRLGYPYKDGAIDEIKHRFGGLPLEAVLEVAGLFAHNLGKDVALGPLSFGVYGSRSASPLCDIPPVLVVETMAEVEQIVAAGDGFDPNWRRRIASAV